MSVDVLTEKYPSFINHTLLLNEIPVMSLDLHTNAKPPKSYFCARWPTHKTTQAGLDAIRTLDSHLRTQFVEPHKRMSGQRRGRIFTNPVGEVNFYLNGHEEPMPFDLDTFLQNNCLRHDGKDPNPLAWIRVNTEYADYWFDGEYSQIDGLTVRKDRRIVGLTGSYNITDQLLAFYQMTTLTLPETKAHEMHKVLSTLLGHLPILLRRIM